MLQKIKFGNFFSLGDMILQRYLSLKQNKSSNSDIYLPQENGLFLNKENFMSRIVLSGLKLDLHCQSHQFPGSGKLFHFQNS